MSEACPITLPFVQLLCGFMSVNLLRRLQALKRELSFMEAEALRFAAALETAAESDGNPTQLTSQLEGRFRFLWGIYRAHSEVRTIASLIIWL